MTVPNANADMNAGADVDGDAYAHPEYLTDAEWVAAHREDPDVVILDCANTADAYQRGHIPGRRGSAGVWWSSGFLTRPGGSVLLLACCRRVWEKRRYPDWGLPAAFESGASSDRIAVDDRAGTISSRPVASRWMARYDVYGTSRSVIRFYSPIINGKLWRFGCRPAAERWGIVTAP